MGDYTMIEIGTFEQTSSSIRISDPCYSKDVWCTHVLIGAKRGIWRSMLLEVIDEDWGRRNAFLIAHHEDYPFPDDFWYMNTVGSFEFGVDSGRAGIFDDSMYEPDTVYRKEYHTLLPHGVFCDSGVGDGGYIGYYDVDKGGKIVALALDFQMLDRPEDEAHE